MVYIIEEDPHIWLGEGMHRFQHFSDQSCNMSGAIYGPKFYLFFDIFVLFTAEREKSR